ncbi:MAG: PhzF family phenazine biosynthesis protein [Rhodothermales bacterium]
MPYPFYQVDAFTDRTFAGNPAAIVLVDDVPSNEWMQHVAAEMSVSETAFLKAREGGAYDLRWFTPIAEVDLCGHATLAAAHVLWQDGHLAAGVRAVFETASGRLSAQQGEEWILMDFPAEEAEELDEQMGLALALGADPSYIGSNRLDILVELDSEATVRSLTPDMGALERIGMRGVIVTARATSDAYDFVSRYFAPRFGIPEDPVTGSAHCCLGPYWMEKLGRSDLVGYQASARGGTVGVEVAGDRVLLKGKAVTVLRGELLA